jgi:general L-amino acid transport system permease protein
MKWLHSQRFWWWAGQAIALVLLIVFVGWLGLNLVSNLDRLNIRLGFRFLQSQASFAIAESVIPYQPQDPYARALLVGLLNSLRVMVVGSLCATVLGISIGIARLSSNWLVRHLALLYVELFRNTPLLLQLFFWYFAVFLSAPEADKPLSLLGGLVQLSNNGLQLIGGLQLSPEFSALLLGLTIYTAAFIAEIVRGGIQAVPKGQWEAANALGFKPMQRMRLIIFPQALRVMIPPLTSQYLNLAKNSSLAIAVGFPDLYATASTTFNQTGRAVEVMILLMATYLSISLLISVGMNRWNRRLLKRGALG